MKKTSDSQTIVYAKDQFDTAYKAISDYLDDLEESMQASAKDGATPDLALQKIDDLRRECRRDKKSADRACNKFMEEKLAEISEVDLREMLGTATLARTKSATPDYESRVSSRIALAV